MCPSPWLQHPAQTGDAMKVLKLEVVGTSLVVQWLRLLAPKAGGLGLIPGQGTTSHILQQRPGTAKEINHLPD